MLQRTARSFAFATRRCKLHAICTTSTPSSLKSPPSWARAPTLSVSSNFSPFLACVAPLLLHGLPCWLSKCTRTTITLPIHPSLTPSLQVRNQHYRLLLRHYLRQRRLHRIPCALGLVRFRTCQLRFRLSCSLDDRHVRTSWSTVVHFS